MKYDVLVINYNTNDLTNACIQSVLAKHDENLRSIYVLDNSDTQKFQLYRESNSVKIIDNYNGKIFSKDELQKRYSRTETNTFIGSLHHTFSLDWFIYEFTEITNLITIDSDAILLRNIDFINENACVVSEIQDCSSYWGSRGTIRFLPIIQYLNLKIIRDKGIRYFDKNRIDGGFTNEKLYDTGGSFLEDVIKNNLIFLLIDHTKYVNHLANASWLKKNPTQFIEANMRYCI